MSSSRKRGEKGRSVEREIKRRRVEGRRRPSSDNEAPLRGHEFEADFETEDRSPFSEDMDYFPLAKSTERPDSKRTRQYRGAGSSDHHKPMETKPHHRKHKEKRERPPRSSSPPPSLPHSLSSGSGHKSSRPLRRHPSSGRNSPHVYEGRHSQEPRSERIPPHTYQSDKDEYRRGERRYPNKEYYESRRGSGSGLLDWKSHRGGSEHSRKPTRSPRGGAGVRGDVRRRGREERGYLPSPGEKLRGRDEYQQRPRKRYQRDLSPPQDKRVNASTSSEESEREGEGPRGVITLRPDDLENFLREKESSRSSSESSGESAREDEWVEIPDREDRKKGTGDSASSYSSSSASEPGSTRRSPRSSSGSVSPEAEGKGPHVPHVLRSKFDVSDGEDSEEEAGPPPLPSSGAITGYQRDLSAGEMSTEEEVQREGEKEGEEGKKEEVTDSQKLSAIFAELDSDEELDDSLEMATLPCYLPGLMGCRNVECYEWLNRIEEGTYGVVHRAKDKKTGEIVALKKLKMEKEREGFPITSLREINMLLKAKHPNIVHVKEIVVGSNMDKIFIVMEFVEHDLKELMETMSQPFTQGEVKTLMIQLLRAVHHLHDNWILHRDLKASNLLLSHKGILKVGDFGLAREYGSPLKNYTPVVVTLWYRAPELLLGAKEYSTAVDMWSVGCIFAEFLKKEPLFRGRSEIDQINLIFKDLGTPSEKIWPGYSKLPTVEKVTFTHHPYNNLRKKFPPTFFSENGFNLLNRFLTYDPVKRISAFDALDHRYLKEPPMAVPPSMFPTWPAKSEKSRSQRKEKSPKPPEGGVNTFLGEDEKPAAAFKLAF